jgi:spore coat protein CotH
MSDELTEVPATLEFEGKVWGVLNVRYKGNSSYLAAPDKIKLSLKLDFDDGNKERTFFGLSKLNLNNNIFDPSQMRETVAYDVFRRAGVPAPRTAYARVYLTVPGLYDRVYAGLYTAVEQIDQTFFKDRFGAKVGLLVKPAGFGRLSYLGDDWKNYEASYFPKVTTKPEDAALLIGLLKLIERRTSDEELEREIGNYLDVDEFLRFLAVQSALVNLDSPLTVNHNYWLTVHPKSHKVIWIPWDLNMSFGGIKSKNPNLSIQRPWAVGAFPLADRVLAIPQMREQYLRVVRQLTEDNFTTKRMGPQIDSIAAAIRDAVAEDRTVPMATFERNLEERTVTVRRPAGLLERLFADFSDDNAPPLRTFVTERAESLIREMKTLPEDPTETPQR